MFQIPLTFMTEKYNQEVDVNVFPTRHNNKNHGLYIK